MTKKITSALCMVVFLLVFQSLTAQILAPPAPEKERVRLFDSDEPLAINFSVSIKDLRANTNDSVYMDQEIQVQNPDGGWETLPFELRTRGNFRLDRCYYPPMRIRMSKDDAKGTFFQGNRKLKLVLPCSKSKSGDSYVAKEYLAYKMNELISEYHFKSRLVNVTFVNLDDRKQEPVELLGFVIEDDEDAAQRFDGEILDGRKITPQIMADTATVLHDFFQMMIGNTDWSGLYQHNQKVMKLDAKTVIPFAYDFDMTGLVNPPYAQVNSNISISKVTERLYRGFCRDESVFQYARKVFLEKENAIMGLVETYKPYYSEAEAKAMKSFLGDFFSILKSDKVFQDQIVESCRKPDGTYAF
jgi:hypothetical protein